MTVELNNGTKLSLNTNDVKEINFLEGKVVVSGGSLKDKIDSLAEVHANDYDFLSSSIKDVTFLESKNKEDIDALSETIGYISKDLDDFISQLKQIRESIDKSTSIENDVYEYGVKLDKCLDIMSNVRDSLILLDSKYKELEILCSNIPTLREYENYLKYEIANLKVNISKNANDLLSIQNDVSSLKEKMTELESKLENKPDTNGGGTSSNPLVGTWICYDYSTPEIFVFNEDMTGVKNYYKTFNYQYDDSHIWFYWPNGNVVEEDYTLNGDELVIDELWIRQK